MKSKVLKYSLLLLCFNFFITLSSQGQLFIDAGNDTVYCTDPYTDTLILGENVKIKTGVEPYTIAWECDVNTYIGRKTASDLLNDSTLVSPIFKYGVWVYVNKVKFILNVTDHEGKVARDTVNIFFSKCGCTLGYDVINLTKGDSVWIDAEPYSPGGSVAAYYWEPSYGLSDPDSAATWCKPDVTTDYYIVTVDTFGCHCSCHALEIRVTATGTNDLELNQKTNMNLKQVGNSIFFNNNLNNEAYISLFSLNGKLLHESCITGNRFDLSNLMPGKGIYIIKVLIGNNTAICKFLND
jgi:hypothetical protein